MSVCFLCKKDGEGVQLRTREAVCGECLLNRESSILETQKLINQLSTKTPPINFWDIITIIVISFIIFALISLYILISNSLFWSLFLIIIGISVAIIINLIEKSNIYNKPFRNDINEQIEKLKSEQNKIRNVLQNIYANFWELPPDWGWRRQQIIENADGKCQECNRERYGSVVPFHVHHKIPKRDIKGNHAIENLMLLCEICHSKIPDEDHKLVKISRDKRLKIQRGKTKSRTGYSFFSAIVKAYQTSDDSRYKNLKEYLTQKGFHRDEIKIFKG